MCRRIVSIHARVRGRRVPLGSDAWTLEVSIHARVRGRRKGAAWQRAARAFQFTPAYAGDIRERPLRAQTMQVSIHARVRGRPIRHRRRRGWRRFNSRPRTRATWSGLATISDGAVSIHARVRGRPFVWLFSRGARPFQFTPAYAGDRKGAAELADRRSFNSRPRTRATQQEA